MARYRAQNYNANFSAVYISKPIFLFTVIFEPVL